MGASRMNWALGLSLAVAVAGGCAKGQSFAGSDGSAGNGGDSGAGASDGGNGMGAAGTGGSGTGNTGDTGGTGSTGMTTDTMTTDTMTTSTSMTTTTTTSGCPMGTHECGGICVGNTPATGCLQSMTCAACPTPANGSAACTADGLCDVNCAVGYMKQGNACVCATQCCSVADCPAGQTCSGGVCSGGGGGSCDPDQCQFTCVATCIIMMKLGIGTCDASNTCNCMCI